MDRKNVTGWNIRQIRLRKGMTVHDLASALPPSAILAAGEVAEIELGSRKVYDYEIMGISRALGVTVADLFFTPQKIVAKTPK
mgnify:CR=1 FL=1